MVLVEEMSRGRWVGVRAPPFILSSSFFTRAAPQKKNTHPAVDDAHTLHACHGMATDERPVREWGDMGGRIVAKDGDEGKKAECVCVCLHAWNGRWGSRQRGEREGWAKNTPITIPPTSMRTEAAAGGTGDDKKGTAGGSNSNYANVRLSVLAARELEEETAGTVKVEAGQIAASPFVDTGIFHRCGCGLPSFWVCGGSGGGRASVCVCVSESMP